MPSGDWKEYSVKDTPVMKHWLYTPQEYIKYKTDSSELYLGVECEVDTRDTEFEDYRHSITLWLHEYFKEKLGSYNNHFYVMHDGSLSVGGIPTGIEITSMPCTLEYHSNTLRSFYEELFQILKNLGFRAHDTLTCGLHVHINRDYFHKKSKLQQDLCIMKLLYLVDVFSKEIEIISRRKSCQYSQKIIKGEHDSVADLYASAKNKGKYSMVNLTHKDTVEFRCFRGTLNLDTFMGTLEFVSLLAKLAKDMPLDDEFSVKFEDLRANFSPALESYYEERLKKHIEEKDRERRSASHYVSYDGLAAYNSQLRHAIDNVESSNLWDTQLINLFNNIQPLSYESTAIDYNVALLDNDDDEAKLRNLKKQVSKWNKQLRNSRNELEKRDLQQKIQGANVEIKKIKRRMRRKCN